LTPSIRNDAAPILPNALRLLQWFRLSAGAISERPIKAIESQTL